MSRLDLKDLQTVCDALGSHLGRLQSSQDEYAKNGNREGAETMRKEWHRVYGVREKVNAEIRDMIANS